MTIEEFIDRLGSKAAVPGGGGAVGIVGAVGAALGQMVCSLTVGKEKYAQYEEELNELITETMRLRLVLLDIVEKDAKAFEPLSKAYGISKDDPEREKIMQDALKLAASVPEETLHVLCDLIDLIERIAQIGTPLAISDAGVAASCCKSALESAALNVYINTKSMTDREYAQRLNETVETLVEKYCLKAEEIYKSVLQCVH